MSEQVLLFPGQGAQQVGMGRELYNASDPARETFEQAGEALGLDLAKICFEGPEEELNRTDVCQPAILSTSIAALRALQEAVGASLVPCAAAGLSLGEYSALVAAGAIGFEEAVRLTNARGRYMQQACDARSGTMYSIIGMEDEPVEQACRRVRQKGGKVWPANYNSPGQLVISGETEAAAEAAALCEENGALRAVQLKVAGAFHSPMMEPADRKLAAELEKTEFRPAAYPVVANVTGTPVEGPEEMRELLAAQVTSPVRWKQSMQWCAGSGADLFLEVGPGRVLRGLLRRIDRSLDCCSVGTEEALGEALERIGT